MLFSSLFIGLLIAAFSYLDFIKLYVVQIDFLDQTQKFSTQIFLHIFCLPSSLSLLCFPVLILLLGSRRFLKLFILHSCFSLLFFLFLDLFSSLLIFSSACSSSVEHFSQISHFNSCVLQFGNSLCCCSVIFISLLIFSVSWHLLSLNILKKSIS